jgi:hypothetical protein
MKLPASMLKAQHSRFFRPLIRVEQKRFLLHLPYPLVPTLCKQVACVDHQLRECLFVRQK